MSEGPPERLGGRVAEWRKGFGQEEGAAPREPESAAGVRERDREEKGTVRTLFLGLLAPEPPLHLETRAAAATSSQIRHEDEETGPNYI